MISSRKLFIHSVFSVVVIGLLLPYNFLMASIIPVPPNIHLAKSTIQLTSHPPTHLPTKEKAFPS